MRVTVMPLSLSYHPAASVIPITMCRHEYIPFMNCKDLQAGALTGFSKQNADRCVQAMFTTVTISI